MTDRIAKSRSRAREGRSSEGFLPIRVSSLCDVLPAIDGLIKKGLTTARSQLYSRGPSPSLERPDKFRSGDRTHLVPLPDVEIPEWYFDVTKG